MRRLVLIGSVFALSGCIPDDPLSPEYAGTWVSAREKNCAEGAKIELSTRRITVGGGELPLAVALFSIQKAEVSGATAHLTMQLEPALDGPHAFVRARSGQSAPRPESEIRVTLNVRYNRIAPSNIQLRDLRTGRIRTTGEEAEIVQAFLTLRRCTA